MRTVDFPIPTKSRASAWLNAYGKTPYAYHELNRRSLEMWPRFLRRLGGGINITWGGELRWAVTAAGAESLIRQAQQMQAWGYPTQLLTAADVQRLEPQLPTPGLLVASHTAIEGHVNTGQVVDGCLRALTAAGAEICIGMPVTGLTMTRTTDGRLVQTVEIGEQAIPCDVVVLAGGAAMPALARMAGVVLPLYDTFGATLLTKPLPPLFQTIALLHSPRDRQPLVNVRQFPDGAVMIQGNGHSNYDMATGATRTQRRRRFWPRPPPLCRAYRAPNFKKFGAAAGRFRKMAKPFSALRPK